MQRDLLPNYGPGYNNIIESWVIDLSNTPGNWWKNSLKEKTPGIVSLKLSGHPDYMVYR